jgi:aryl-alcohol dehydrogenase-like predicted oxidoreductase
VYDKDGAMRYEHSGDRPVYAPNSQGGPKADPVRFGDPGWHVEGDESVRAAAARHPEDDDFELGIAERLGLSRFESLQAYYTLAGRDLERELVPMLKSEGVGLMVWSPLAGGLLSGKYGREQQGEKGSRRTTFDFPPVNRDRAYDCIDAMRPIAQTHRVSVAQVALAWLLHQPQVTSVIIGARRPEQLTDHLAATQVALSDSELATLDEVSRLPAEYPGWMFERQGEYRRKQLLDARR